jgi:hypothetical protein
VPADALLGEQHRWTLEHQAGNGGNREDQEHRAEQDHGHGQVKAALDR